MLREKIQALAAQFTVDAVAIRHHLHMHPELSYQEFETSKFIRQQLTEYGIAGRYRRIAHRRGECRTL